MDEIIAPWAEFASLPMYEDNKITWYTRGNANFLELKLEELESDIGVDFKRVKKKRKAEIRYKKIKEFDNPLQLGNAYWHPNDPVWRLKVKRGKENRSTQLHEFGHALGLGHPEDHYANTDTIMSYARDRTIHDFFKRDKEAIKRIYTDSTLEFSDVKIGPVNIDELTGIRCVEYI